MNKHKSNKIKENSNTVRHLIMGQIITTQNLVATKVVRLAGQRIVMFSWKNRALWRRVNQSSILTNPVLLLIGHLGTLRNKLQWNINRNSYFFIHDNTVETIVCKIAVILSRLQCDNRAIGIFILISRLFHWINLQVHLSHYHTAKSFLNLLVTNICATELSYHWIK